MHIIAKKFDYISINAAHEMCARLEKKGYIERNAVGKYRFVKGK
jgi:predicted transcriptional regulator of viral defense system